MREIRAERLTDDERFESFVAASHAFSLEVDGGRLTGCLSDAQRNAAIAAEGESFGQLASSDVV
jgi:hypothetical protein